ncbi:MAG TPA: hypothetical protein VNW49_12385 [Puia sp.]|nr:hypothetical protein [Puia sp.]
MKINYCLRLMLGLFFFSPLHDYNQEIRDSVSAVPQNPRENGLFDSYNVLEISLKGNVRELLNDRSDNPRNHPFHLIYKGEDSSLISVPVEAKTRGNFRKQKGNCSHPPVLLQFPKGDIKKSSIFKDNKKLKLVMPCRGDQSVIHEWLVYRLYNLITPKSFRARLVKVKLEDSKNNKEVKPFYGMLLEEEKQMAERNGDIPDKRKLRPEEIETNSFITLAVFEYLIGNTDWSIQFLHNIKLISNSSGSAPIAVPYDFDMSGIVNTFYAKPAEELNMRSVRHRRYRGYCILDMKKYDESIALYNKLKEDIYSLYTKCSLLDAKYIKSTVNFLNDFYTTINDAKEVKNEFEYPCYKHGTGHIVIKGLSK